jgi:AcrR family transcriptional regulator
MAPHLRDAYVQRNMIGDHQSMGSSAGGPRKGSHETAETDVASARRIPNTPKSRRTRARILDRALDLFASEGYAAATNARIAEAANLTRGAMLYHFPDRESLLEAAVEHIQTIRTRLFEEAGANAPHGDARTDHAIDVYWSLLSHPAFVAFSELEAAARTDAMVAARVAAAQDAFDRAQGGPAMFALVQGASGARFQTSRDLARFMLEGLARARLTYDSDERTERLLAVVKRAARMLNRRVSGADLWPEG